ncbi:flagellar biosynthesis protein FlhB [Thalassococcus sp. S3]|uniref:EscU/YscU/HrcU family type III secretion system export apparatus switch protein n=1 Tax=Thalassococcus sp. S3 TaxID=2017482 RepID=UPI0010240F99|nr:flagellar type III secretion system protein FlhB [Thalassococcus sp. S3]QBF29698.1 flagellar biosynthesis protein FlhB [Thalassococcus sp. S3]
MSQQDEEAEKSHEATPQKLEKARKKGEIAKSTDLLVAASYAGLILAMLASGAYAVSEAGTLMMVLLDQSAALSALVFGEPASAPMGGILLGLALPLSPIFGIPFFAVILAIFAQRAFVFAPTKLAPKLSRISLIGNAKNKFGRSGLFEFAKSFIKLLIYSICLTFFLRARSDEIVSTLHSSPEIVASYMMRLCVEFLAIVLLVALVIGGIDAVWQFQEHLRKNRMSRKELLDETKEAEGDPHLKGERRQRGQAIARSQMMAEVPDADVVIVNPTHYAVALKWSRQAGEAPVCVAKGVDEIAAKIREIATEAAVPIHHDPPTARALYATMEIGQEIDEVHYPAVAAAIRFAEQMRQRAKGRVT